MKKILAIVLAAAMLLSMTACGAAAKKDTYVVGICQLVQHDALDAATKGFQDALTEALGDKVSFEVQNASGESVNCTTIINGFVSSKVDLIMANATPALQAVVAPDLVRSVRDGKSRHLRGADFGVVGDPRVVCRDHRAVDDVHGQGGGDGDRPVLVGNGQRHRYGGGGRACRQRAGGKGKHQRKGE